MQGLSRLQTGKMTMQHLRFSICFAQRARQRCSSEPAHPTAHSEHRKVKTFKRRTAEQCEDFIFPFPVKLCCRDEWVTPVLTRNSRATPGKRCVDDLSLTRLLVSNPVLWGWDFWFTPTVWTTVVLCIAEKKNVTFIKTEKCYDTTSWHLWVDRLGIKALTKLS